MSVKYACLRHCDKGNKARYLPLKILVICRDGLVKLLYLPLLAV